MAMGNGDGKWKGNGKWGTETDVGKRKWEMEMEVGIEDLIMKSQYTKH